MVTTFKSARQQSLGKLPQLWYPRANSDLIPKLDQNSFEKRAQFLSRPVVSKYEEILTQKLRKTGLTVHSQFSLGDMDNGVPFEWRYDLYVEEKPSDKMDGLIIEVDGASHNSEFQKKQDARKDYLARLLGFGKVFRLNNEDVQDANVVEYVKYLMSARKYMDATKR